MADDKVMPLTPVAPLIVAWPNPRAVDCLVTPAARL